MRRLLHRFAPAFSLALFTLALWLLHRQLEGFRFQEVMRFLSELPSERLGLALLWTAAGYLSLTLFDVIGFRHLGHPMPYRRVALATFIGYSFSNTLGQALLTNTPIRLRFYTAWGIVAEEIAKLVALAFVTFWVGFAFLGGVVFTFSPQTLPPELGLPLASDRAIGVACLVLLAFYLAACIRIRRPLVVRGWTLHLPRLPLALAQMVVGAAEIVAMTAVLHVLLPAAAGLHFSSLLGFVLLAQVAGVLSQVPGGLGVFETVMVILLQPTLPAAPVLAALVAFRVMYYLLPLAISVLLLAGHELVARRESVERAAGTVGRWASTVVPPALAAAVLVAGALLLFSGALPAAPGRLAWLRLALPLPVLELSHLVASVVGMGLVLLARGLQRRLDGAFHLAVGLLALGIVASMLRGGPGQALALAGMLAVLLPCRRHFDRRASLLRERQTPGWIATVLLVLAASVWLGLVAYRHVELSGELWWRFAWSADAPRFLRASVASAGLVLLVGLARLLSAAPPDLRPPSDADLDDVARLARASPRAADQLALIGDKTLLFDDARRAFLMFAVQGRSWVTLGDPVGPEPEATELVWRFQALCRRHDDWPVFYQVPEASLPRYVDLGCTLLKIGEAARVPLTGFSLEGGKRKDLRQARRRLEEREGCRFEILPPGDDEERWRILRAISDAWLEAKNVREKSFSLGRFDPAYLRRFPLAVVRRGERIVAFANLMESGDREEMTVDLMRYGPEAPGGVMDYLFTALMLHGSAAGYRYFNLGMAPLSGLEPEGEVATLWQRLGTLVYRHGEEFYNFQGLRLYKEKWNPVWESRYLAAPGALSLPQVLTDLATLIAGGLGGLVGK